MTGKSDLDRPLPITILHRNPVSSNRLNHTGLEIYHPYTMIALIGDIESALVVDGQRRWFIECRLGGRAPSPENRA